MTVTLRQQILLNIVDILETMVEGSPVGADAYEMEFSLVTRRPIEKLATGKQYAVGVYDNTELIAESIFPLVNKELRVDFEFHAHVSTDEDQSTVLNFVLGTLQRRLREDIYIGGLALDFIELGNEFDIEGPYDKQVSGVLTMLVKYRHNQDDPRAAV